MTCPKCGAQLPDDAVFCAQCGATTQNSQAANTGGVTPPYPPNNTYNNAPQPPMGPPINGTTYLVFAILVTVLCCLPAGIGAIVYATKIDKAWAMGDYIGAQDAAKKSKMWSIIGAVGGVVVAIVYFVFMFMVGFSTAYY